MGAQVGVDLEFKDREINLIEMPNLVFTGLERAFFNSLNFVDKINFFYNTWSKKESIVKACGYGLSYPINTIETFDIIDNKVIGLKKGSDTSKEFYCYTINLHPDFASALSSENKISKIICAQLNDVHDMFSNFQKNS